MSSFVSHAKLHPLLSLRSICLKFSRCDVLDLEGEATKRPTELAQQLGTITVSAAWYAVYCYSS